MTFLLVAFLGGFWAWGCGQPRTASTLPPPASTACAVALAPSGPGEERDREIARLQAEARRGRRSKQALEQLGYRYVASARVRNDPGDYTLAVKTAECLESIDPQDAAALLLRGHALHQLHRFGEAEQIARRLIGTREFVLDYGLLGDVLMEQGRLAEAAEAYQKMIDLKPFYQSYTRAAHLRWLRGDLQGAVELIHLAIEAVSPRDRESVAWAYTRLSTYQLQGGRLDDAARAADAALTYQPDYAAALLVRGRVLLATGRPADAVLPLRRAAHLNSLPEYQWALADTLRLVGQDAEAATVERALITIGVDTDPRTVSLFLATRRGDVGKAVALAERELQTRGDIFTVDALAWALAAGGRLDEAWALMRRALSEGTEDGRLFLHAGAIAVWTDRQEEADNWLNKAKTLEWTLLPSERDTLVTLISTRQEK